MSEGGKDQTRKSKAYGRVASNGGTRGEPGKLCRPFSGLVEEGYHGIEIDLSKNKKVS